MALAVSFMFLPPASCHLASTGTTTGKRAPRRFSSFIGGPFGVISSISKAIYRPEREASHTAHVPVKCTVERERFAPGKLELECMTRFDGVICAPQGRSFPLRTDEAGRKQPRPPARAASTRARRKETRKTVLEYRRRERRERRAGVRTRKSARAD